MRPIVALGCASLAALAPATATAHFYIDYPGASDYPGPSPVPWWNEDSLGSPQKLGPCGDEDDGTQGGGGPTGVVTPFAPGQTVTLQWTEVISHAGWFRIALAADRNDFVDPPIEVAANGNSADAGIENPPVAPVLADGIYPHPLGALTTWPPYSITLPNTPCAKCTIQIIQVMLDHPSNLGNLPDGAPNPDGFLYHHCIDISIGALDGGSSSGGHPADAGSSDSGPGGSGSSSGSGSGSGSSSSGGSGSGSVSSSSGGSGSGSGSGIGDAASPQSSSGCGCTTAKAPAATGAALSLLFLGLLSRRRRT
jgi:MYXO-CTERM domain-containing protein